MYWVVFQWPSDGTNSLVTSRLTLQPDYVLLHRPSRSAQAGGRPAPRAAEPGKKAPVPGVRARDIYGRTQKGMGSFSQEERAGHFHHHYPRTLPSGPASCSSLRSLSHPRLQHMHPHTGLGCRGEGGRQDCSVAKGKRYIPIAITALKMI